LNKDEYIEYAIEYSKLAC